MKLEIEVPDGFVAGKLVFIEVRNTGTWMDEVNVSTVAQYVQRYSKDTQFIMITHRKGSMEVCNALYGVAMEERGISKVVSARFNG